MHRVGNRKTCSRCRVEKSVEDFAPLKNAKDGLRYECKECTRLEAKEYREKHPDKKKANQERYLANNPEKRVESLQKYRENNKESIKISSRKHQVKHRERLRPSLVARNAERRARKLLATVKWANKSKIKTFYLEAVKMTQETGEKYHVDHIVPLINKLVCGLHCEQNLQILTAKDNVAKSNRFSVGEQL